MNTAGVERKRLSSGCLPWWEHRLYFCVWIVLAARAVYAVYKDSYEHQFVVKHELQSGWSFINRSKDTSDGEWAICSNALRNGFIWWLIGHIAIGQIARWSYFESRSSMFIVYDVIALLCTIGWRAFIMITAETIILYVTACVTASQVAVWIISGLSLLVFQFRITYSWLTDLQILPSTESMLVEYGIAMALLRSTSFALTICMQRLESRTRAVAERQRDHQMSEVKWQGVPDKEDSNGSDLFRHPDRLSLKNALCYIFYLPTFFTGPLMPFDTFVQQFHRPLQPWTASRISTVACLVARVLLWILVFELTIHFFYFSALFMKPNYVLHTSLWTAAGVSYMHGQYFMVKYFVIFGGAGAMALFDQITTPGPPNCISRMYRYSSMWRSFDRGLYSFMSRHIYFALGGSRRGLWRRIVATVLCFAFVYTWHGMWIHILYWALMNFAGIVVESVADHIGQTSYIRDFENLYLSPAWSRRLRSFLTIPLTAMSCFAIFVFFAGNNVGYIIFRRLIFDGFPSSTLLLLFALYCFNNTCRDVELWDARRQTKKRDIWDGVDHVD